MESTDSSLTSLPKAIIEKSEALLKVLLGDATKEVGGLITDQVRYIRFRNQIKIFAKADEFIKESGLSIRPIELKVLVPLIEASSLEEDETIQEKWAAMLANIASLDSDSEFNRNCIEVFGRLSSKEIAMLDYCYEYFVEQFGEVVAKEDGKLVLVENKLLFTEQAKFSPLQFKEAFQLSDFRVRLYTENLTGSGLLQFEEVDWDPLEKDLIVSQDTYITYLGLYFVRLCKYE